MSRDKSREETLLDKIDGLRAEVARLTLVLTPMADEIERLEAEIERLRAIPRDIQVADSMIRELRAEVERLRAALQALHDWYVEYARINNLFNADGTPATFHELLQARAALEPKP